MIIDAHNHPDWHEHDFDASVEEMSRFGIGLTWLLSWECPVEEADPAGDRYFFYAGPGGPVPFSACLEYARRAPDAFVPGYAPDPRVPGAVERLAAAVRDHGVRVCGEVKLRMRYDEPCALELFRYCGRAGLPVVLHMDHHPVWWYGGGIGPLENALKACPETIFLGHAPGFWVHISGDGGSVTDAYPAGKVVPGGELIRLLDAYPNLYCDLSAGSGLNAMKRDPDHARVFLSHYSRRVLYARDMFGNDHQEFLRGLGLAPEALDDIFSGNALRLVPPGG